MITVVKPGLLTTVQDLGRVGYQHHGIVVGGSLDGFASRVANLIVGNDDHAAVLEMAQTGPDLRFEEAALVAWCGADFEATLAGQPLPRDRAVRVAAGEVIRFGRAQEGLRAWLAVAGGIDVPLVMGSRTTYRRAGIGGHQGRPLAAGDQLKVGPASDFGAQVLHRLVASGARAATWTVRPATLGRAAPKGTVRALRGPEWDWFKASAHKAFFNTEWVATRQADRMGVRIEGADLDLIRPREMVSCSVNAGVVQVPPDGSPIVLLPSRQSIGGYPRLATVATADLGVMAQLRPGDKVRFTEIALPTAHDLLLSRERDLGRIRLGLARLLG